MKWNNRKLLGLRELRSLLNERWLWCNEIFYLISKMTNLTVIVIFNFIGSKCTVHPKTILNLLMWDQLMIERELVERSGHPNFNVWCINTHTMWNPNSPCSLTFELSRPIPHLHLPHHHSPLIYYFFFQNYWFPDIISFLFVFHFTKILKLHKYIKWTWKT